MNISSGPVFGPIQPQNMPNFDMLNDKQFAADMDMRNGGGMQAISYGNNAFGGTDFSTLSDQGYGQGANSAGQDISMQQIASFLGQQAQALLQFVALLQQLLNNAQAQDSSNAGTGAGAGAGNGNASGWPQATGENAAAQPATTPVSDPAQQSGVTPTNASLATPAGQSEVTPTNASLATPAAESVQTPTPTSGGVSTAQGRSGLHLPEPLQRYEGAIMKASENTDIPPEVLAAQIWQESRGQQGAVTVNGGNGLSDSGVMQVNQNTFADLQSKHPNLLGPNASPTNADDSIMAGALYMQEQMENFDGNLGAALRAYNSGPGNVNVDDLSDISKTGTGDATYVDKVLNFANIIKTGNGTLPA